MPCPKRRHAASATVQRPGSSAAIGFAARAIGRAVERRCRRDNRCTLPGSVGAASALVAVSPRHPESSAAVAGLRRAPSARGHPRAPFAAARRRRADGDFDSEATDDGPRVAPARSRSSPARSASQGELPRARSRAPGLRVPAFRRRHQVPVDLPGRTIASVEIRFSTIFVATRSSACSGDDLRPVTARIDTSASSGASSFGTHARKIVAVRRPRCAARRGTYGAHSRPDPSTTSFGPTPRPPSRQPPPAQSS